MAERLGPGLKIDTTDDVGSDPSEVDRSITLKIATDAFGFRIQPAEPDDSYPELRRPHAPGQLLPLAREGLKQASMAGQHLTEGNPTRPHAHVDQPFQPALRRPSR